MSAQENEQKLSQLSLDGESSQSNTSLDGAGNEKQARQQQQQQQKKAKKQKNKVQANGTGSNDPLELSPPPAYIDHRVQIFEKLKQKYDQDLSQKLRNEIKITLPDGSVKTGRSWETSPMDVAREISSGLAQRVIIAKVSGASYSGLWDLQRPLEEDVKLELLDFDSGDEAKAVFWHSSAHILGEACERHYGCHLCIGPPIEDGFYYEMGMPTGEDGQKKMVHPSDYSSLETLAKNITKEKQPFERLVLSKEDLLEMFKHNPFKVHIIKDKIPDGTSTTVYRCGPLIDLCRGPHVPDTSRVKAFSVSKASASYFLGDAKNESLQRIYGISFPSSKQLTEHKKFLEEAAKRDHRKIGKDQELFFFNELSPGSCFFLPHGARIYNTLVEFIRKEYHERGFKEVVTPNIFNVKLWETSGHWQNYRENMFSFEVEKETYALKPMNCPSHCIMFSHRDRSYRELPLRLADFGVLHRNEFSGALTGLTRVRRFQQDDAHIFCMPEQIEQEMSNCIDFLKHVYGIFGFQFTLKLSTRPEKYLGTIEKWQQAEKMLEESLNKSGFPWEINEGDGAFYGPKIDITIKDALNRRHQCATMQLDFQLPEKFNLSYVSNNPGEGKAQCRPVIIHRAIYGSVERLIAILTESYAGKWPFWISPRQCTIVPVSLDNLPYANEVKTLFHSHGLYVEVDDSDNTLPKKIRNAEISQVNFIIVVGKEEQESKTLNIRPRDAEVKGKSDVVPIQQVLDMMLKLKADKK
ncbi:hypothetical protein MIR68_000945 [Amoeboaphelidium protococcarum]|nr:hypothetical protein MIR68_000945 [Amoeboaphelidium protococcarum]